MSNKIEQYLLYQIIKLYTDNGRKIRLYDSIGKNGFCITVKKNNQLESVGSPPKGFYNSPSRTMFKFHTKPKYSKSYLRTIMLGNFYAWSLLRFKLKDGIL